MATGDTPHGLLTLVCITCGHEKHFALRPPSGLRCERCGGRVFRNYFTPVEADEATVAQLEQTARSLAFDDQTSSITDDEVRDLDEHAGGDPDATQT